MKTYITIIFFLNIIFVKSQEIGKVLVKRNIANEKLSFITAYIFQASTSDTLKLSDIWIKNKRYACDSTGKIYLILSPKNYVLTARAFGFKNYEFKLSVKKNEAIQLNIFLVPENVMSQ